jgi:hypothetical protein
MVQDPPGARTQNRYCGVPVQVAAALKVIGVPTASGEALSGVRVGARSPGKRKAGGRTALRLSDLPSR